MFMYRLVYRLGPTPTNLSNLFFALSRHFYACPGLISVYVNYLFILLNNCKANQNIIFIHQQDPYDIQDGSYDQELLPAIDYMDIVNYLVFSKSAYTQDEMRAFKGLEAYNQFVCGWVRDVQCKIINNKHVVFGKVI